MINKKIIKPFTMLAPLPVAMVTVGNMENSNIITVAWTGVVNSNPPRVYISVRKERHSYGMLMENGQFVINLTPHNLTAVADYCGFRSGRDIDKFSEMKLTKQPSTQVDTPIIAECPVNVECKVFQTVDLGSHTMFLADVLSVNVDESIVDEDGKINTHKANLINYQHGDYYSNGKLLGRFGFAIQRKFIRNNGKGVGTNMNSSLTRRKKRK